MSRIVYAPSSSAALHTASRNRPRQPNSGLVKAIPLKTAPTAPKMWSSQSCWPQAVSIIYRTRLQLPSTWPAKLRMKASTQGCGSRTSCGSTSLGSFDGMTLNRTTCTVACLLMHTLSTSTAKCRSDMGLPVHSMQPTTATTRISSPCYWHAQASTSMQKIREARLQSWSTAAKMEQTRTRRRQNLTDYSFHAQKCFWLVLTSARRPRAALIGACTIPSLQSAAINSSMLCEKKKNGQELPRTGFR